MKEITITDKVKYLKEHYPFQHIPDIESEMVCLDCDTVFKVRDYKVFKNVSGEEFICCPKAPDCEGTVVDWMPLD